MRRLLSGDIMPSLGLGTWLSDRHKLHQAVKTALDIGYRHIDCAAIYLNEDVIGEAIAVAIAAGVVERQELWLTSKLWNSYHAAADVEVACRQSLQDLQVDYLDLYLIHWPVAFHQSVGMNSDISSVNDLIDLKTLPISETWQAMEKLVDQGLVKNIGVSNFSQRHLQELLENSRIKPAVNQVESHPYWQQQELLQFCQQHQVQMEAYAPLGSRAKRERFPDDNVAPDLFEDPSILAIAEKHQATPAQILIAWQLARDVVTIPKSVTPSRLQENWQAQGVQLDANDTLQIATIGSQGRSFDAAWWDIPSSPYTQEFLWG